jgi:glycosyltransferase involved in cell wall biosynthesis
VVYNGTDVSALRVLLNTYPTVAADAAGNAPIRALFSGTLGDNYDIPTILQAAKRYRTLPNGRSLRFVVAGDGPLRSLVEAAAARAEIDYLGTLGPSQLAKAYGESDIGLISYRHESNVGIPDKFYDYIAAGLPVVSSLRDDVASLISKWQIGECYRPGDPTDLVAAIGRITEDSGTMRATAMRAWTKAEVFDQGAQYAEYAAFLERLTCSRRHDRP